MAQDEGFGLRHRLRRLVRDDRLIDCAAVSGSGSLGHNLAGYEAALGHQARGDG